MPRYNLSNCPGKPCPKWPGLPPHPRPVKVLLPLTLPPERVLTDAVVDARLWRGDFRDSGAGGQLWPRGLHTGWREAEGKGVTLVIPTQLTGHLPS